MWPDLLQRVRLCGPEFARNMEEDGLGVMRWAIGLAVIYGAVVLAMYLMQRSFQYFPTHRGLSPAEVGLTGVSVVSVGDGRASLWVSPARKGQVTVLYFQGNAGEIVDRADRLAFYQAQGLGAAFLSYRGYGPSSATISETGMIADALAAYDWLRVQGLFGRQIVVLGESLGTGIAVQVDAQREVAALELEAPYTSTAEVAAGQFCWLPVRWLMKDQYRSIDLIAGVKAPLLVQHGDADTVIPFAHGEALFAKAAGEKSFVALPGRGHEALFEASTWAQEVTFFSRLKTP